MSQNMGRIVNTSDKSSQHKLDILKKTFINEEIAIIGIAEINSDWSKIPMKENIYNRKDGWIKTKRIITGYN